jgi:two-component system sensor histidine kinase AlgZ
MSVTPINDPTLESRGWRAAYWLCQILGWGAYVAVGLAVAPADVRVQPACIGGYVLFFFYSIALTHGLRALIHRQQWLSLSPGRAGLRLLSAVIIVGTIQALLIILVQAIWTRTNPISFGPRFAVLMWFNTMAASTFWITAYAGLTSLQRARRARLNATALELGMREARLQSLEAQVNPHFLFNCLNSVRGLIVENPPRAQDMVTRLANILRHNLTRRTDATEPLSEQIAVITDYLELESVRFEERLRIRLEIAPDTRDCLIPWMLLQTLVENAIKHGIAQLPDGGEILVRSRIHQNLLEITVENTGTLGASPQDSTQVGLANLRERLRLLHGPAASLTLTAHPPDRVKAIALIPFQHTSTLRT